MKIRTTVIALLTVTLVSSCAQAKKDNYSLDFDQQKYEKQTLEYNGQKLEVRAFEKIVYVAHPVDTVYQTMNIYIPEAYFNGGSINGYSAETAPVFFPNQVGGYMPAMAASTKGSGFGGMPPMGGGNGNRPQGMPEGNRPPMDRPQKENTVLAALSKGYIVASAGARGRTNKDANGTFYGKAPAGIVDLKAAVRYLKYNDKVMPGDANKIISNGTSAGGAMSTLLGATGDNPDYQPYLDELGAANAGDAIFAVSAYCPITNLEHADMAYEWQFNGVNIYQKRGAPGAQESSSADLTDTQIKVSANLKALFPAYVNSLQLKGNDGSLLALDENGNGSFKTLVKSYVIESANKALSSGTDLSQHTWLTIQDGKVTDLDWDAYIRYMERMKTPPAFDALDLSSGENNEFGTATVDNQHFTEYGQQNSTVDKATRIDEHIVKMMNPMYYISAPNTQTSKYWRIRHGSKDKDTGLAISAILATYLQNKEYSVDYALPWDKPHSGDYDLDELFRWIDSISK